MIHLPQYLILEINIISASIVKKVHFLRLQVNSEIKQEKSVRIIEVLKQQLQLEKHAKVGAANLPTSTA